MPHLLLGVSVQVFAPEAQARLGMGGAGSQGWLAIVPSSRHRPWPGYFLGQPMEYCQNSVFPKPHGLLARASAASSSQRR